MPDELTPLDQDPFPTDYAGKSLGSMCVLWDGPVTPRTGYGKQYVGMIDGKRTYRLPHRVAYEEACGAVPNGLQIDHLCGTRLCINPQHLEAVTPQENVRRSRGWVNDVCPRGHHQPEPGKCKACKSRRQLEWQHMKWRKDNTLRDQQRERRARKKAAA